MGAKILVRRVRTLLVLGRISNLPTVWSNCLAAWLLGGSGPWQHFALLALGATLLYTGGMFLNDAVDVEFDRKHRAERPIISGQVSTRYVIIASVVLLLAGWACFVPLGTSALVYSLALVIVIVLYDVVHKKTSLAPLLMAACRFFLYLAAASAAQSGVGAPTTWHALGLSAYIVGLSYIARKESTSSTKVTWPVPLLFVPLAIGVVWSFGASYPTWIAALAVASWICWCISARRRSGRAILPRGIAGLLVGIALLDWLTALSVQPGVACVCVGLFFLAIVLQRVAPAT